MSKAKLDRLRALAKVAAGDRETLLSEFTMRIPAERDRDADLVLSWAADEIEQWREWFEEYQLDISMAAQGASPANLEQAVEATRDCFICGGDGVVYDAKCDNCDGTGIQPETTKNSSGLSDFIRNASPEEKERVYEKVIDEANEAQRKLTEQDSECSHESPVETSAEVWLCEDCGAESVGVPFARPEQGKCQMCEGKGSYLDYQPTPDGDAEVEQQCEECGGTGVVTGQTNDSD